MVSNKEIYPQSVPNETDNPITVTPVRKRGRPRKSDISKVSEGVVSSSAEEFGENADKEGLEAENGSHKSKRVRRTLPPRTPDSETREIRIRKPVERLAEFPLKSKIVKTLEIPPGKGIPIAEFPNIAEKLAKKSNDDAILKALHLLIWGKSQTKNCKANIKQFHGLVLKSEKDEVKFRTKIERWSVSELKELCEFLCLNETGHKESLVERVFEFILEPRPEESSGKRKSSSLNGRKSKRISTEHTILTAFELFVADQAKLREVDNAIMTVALQTPAEILIGPIETSKNIAEIIIAPAEAPITNLLNNNTTLIEITNKNTSDEVAIEEKMKKLWDELPEDEKLKYINQEMELSGKKDNVDYTTTDAEEDSSFAENNEENGNESELLQITPRARGRPRGTSKTHKSAKPLTPTTPGATIKKRGRPLSENSRAAAALAQEEKNEINTTEAILTSKGSIPDDKDLIADISEILKSKNS
ncbi:hypothetical protein HK096_003226 [Nowakowskiella sp. JEL0078]|nr:hypothetical protein HK096_003226 [Nowakowskiella sp. JEL0078]